MKTISLRIGEGQLKRIAFVEEEEELDRSAAFRKIIEAGLKQVYLENAIEKYVNGEISTWKAAEIAGVTLRKMNETLLEKGISLHYSKQSLKEDLG
ncbi:UPF0175 family protein [Candidatus Micrarchaeota archaeon]|nr:UPF0175 family protein [Candidatus Micrarchaeota archaeon]